MKKYLLPLLALAALASLAGCQTINFQRTATSSTATPADSDWHHDGIFALVEFSDPVEPKAGCAGKDWDSVTVNHSFLNVLVGLLTNNLYTPWSVGVNCR